MFKLIRNNSNNGLEGGASLLGQIFKKNFFIQCIFFAQVKQLRMFHCGLEPTRSDLGHNSVGHAPKWQMLAGY